MPAKHGANSRRPHTPWLALMTVICCLVWVSSPGPTHAEPTNSSYDTARAERFVSDYAKRHGLPGLAWAVVKDGEPVAEGATGGLGVDTPVSIGSVSKSVTAFAVLQQVDLGTIGLDDPVTDHLPGFRAGGTDPSAITIRMLLSHTSGLPNPVLVPSADSLAGTVSWIAEVDTVDGPGQSYLYSNLNYWTLARLVEVVAGEEFNDYLAAHIFEPLGMDATRSVATAAPTQGLDNGHVTAWGTAVQLPEMSRHVTGAGGVISTAQDMGKWLRMQQRGGLSEDGTRLLSQDLIAESHTVQPNAKTYGFGWQHTSTADPLRIGHAGTMTRFSSRQDLVPSSGYGVVVLANSYTTTFDHPFAITTGLIDISEGVEPDLGRPVATIIDGVLAAGTLLVLALGARGVLRSRRWAGRRASFPVWRVVLRHLPQAILPVAGAALVIGLTAGPRNPAVPLDAFGLWPAATTLLVTGAVVGAVLIVLRTVRWQQVRRRGEQGPDDAG